MVMSYVIALLTILGVGPLAQAQEATADAPPAFVLPARLTGDNLSPHVATFEDPGGQLTFADAQARAAAGAFRGGYTDRVHMGFSRSAFWATIRIRNPGPAPRRVFLENAIFGLDHVTLYLPRADGSNERLELGDRVAFSRRPVPYRFPVFPWDAPPGEWLVYVNARSEGPLQLPFKAWDPDAFQQAKLGEYLLIGVSFGIVVVMCLYNLFLFVTSRESIHLLYAAYVASWILTQQGFLGTGMEYVFPDSDTNYASNEWLIAGVTLSCFFAGLFAMRFLDLAQWSPRLHRLLVGLCALALANAVAALTLDYRTVASLVNAVAGVFSLVLLASGISGIRRGYRPAQFYTAAWFILLSSNALWVLRYMGLVPTTFLSEWGIFIGASAEAVLLSLALGHRIALIKADRLSAVREKEKLEASLEAARAVQEALLPEKVSLPGLAISEYYEAAERTGGDWYTYRHDPVARRLYVLMGDVTGHGIPSALVTGAAAGAAIAALQALAARSVAPDLADALRQVAGAVNEAVLQTGARTQSLMTMVFLAMDLDSGRTHYLNAGHVGILIAGGDGVRSVLAQGQPLGFDATRDFGERTFTVAPGERVFLYTDGLTENGARHGAFRQQRQLRRLLQAQGRPEDVLPRIVRFSKESWADARAEDDVSALLIERKAS